MKQYFIYSDQIEIKTLFYSKEFRDRKRDFSYQKLLRKFKKGDTMQYFICLSHQNEKTRYKYVCLIKNNLGNSKIKT